MESAEARRVNRSKVLAQLLSSEATTRAELATLTQLSPATVSRVADLLLIEGVAAEGPPVASRRRGRNATSLHLHDSAGVVCGVDLGGTNCRFVLCDLRGQPMATVQELTPADHGATEIADWIASRVIGLAEKGTGPLRAVAVGVPGVVSPEGPVISGAPNVPQIEGADFARALARAIPVALTLDNDSNLALLGELKFGAGRGLTTMVMFTIGTGLGAGVALDGQLRRGRSGLVGEFGYLPTGPSGERAETLLSGAGLAGRARALGAPVSSAQDIFTSTAPEVLRPVQDQFDQALLLTLAAASVAYEPEAIIIGGGLSPVAAARLPATQQRLRELVPVVPDILMAQLGDLSGALGASTAACHSAYLQLGLTTADAGELPPQKELIGFGHTWSPGEEETDVRIATAR